MLKSFSNKKTLLGGIQQGQYERYSLCRGRGLTSAFSVLFDQLCDDPASSCDNSAEKMDPCRSAFEHVASFQKVVLKRIQRRSPPYLYFTIKQDVLFLNKPLTFIFRDFSYFWIHTCRGLRTRNSGRENKGQFRLGLKVTRKWLSSDYGFLGSHSV